MTEKTAATLWDFHCHSNLSYCASRDMSVSNIRDALAVSPHPNAVIADHGFAIYFPPEETWDWTFMSEAKSFDQHRDSGNLRLQRHIENFNKHKTDNIKLGIETEMMNNGELTFDHAFADQFDIIIGSIHYLPVNDNAPSLIIYETWIKHLQELLTHDIDILGHPLRYLEQRKVPIDRRTIEFVVGLVKSAGVAMELNSHSKSAYDNILLEEILRQNVTLAFATDSHKIADIGDFSYQFSCLDKIGASLSDFKMLKL